MDKNSHEKSCKIFNFYITATTRTHESVAVNVVISCHMDKITAFTAIHTSSWCFLQPSRFTTDTYVGKEWIHDGCDSDWWTMHRCGVV